MASPIDKINKLLKKDIAFTGKTTREKIDSLSTGIISLDYILGNGGFPKGRVVDINGLSSTGKSSLCLHTIAEAQKKGITCAYIDAEYSFILKHAQKLGVNTDELIIIQPDSGEEAFEAMEILIKEKVGVIVVDSVSALSPRAEIEAEIGKPQMGSQARLVSQGLRRLMSPISKNNTVVLFINQMRQNIMGGRYNPYIVAGGMALKFYSSIRLEMKRTAVLSLDNKQLGHTIEFHTAKNKVFEPNKRCSVKYFLDGGFEKEGNIFEIAEEAEVLTRKGNTYYFGDTKIAIGKEKAAEALMTDSDLRQQILDSLLSYEQSQKKESKQSKQD